MVFNVPMDKLSLIPISYHMALALCKAPLTSLRSFHVSYPEGVGSINTVTIQWASLSMLHRK